MRKTINERFRVIADGAANAAGSPWATAAAASVVLIWAITGPLFHFSDTWQLVINTGTTIVTFLMVFLIQSSTNRSARAMQLKLDEIVVKSPNMDSLLANVENMSDDELDRLAEHVHGHRERRRAASGPPPQNPAAT